MLLKFSFLLQTLSSVLQSSTMLHLYYSQELPQTQQRVLDNYSATVDEVLVLVESLIVLCRLLLTAALTHQTCVSSSHCAFHGLQFPVKILISSSTMEQQFWVGAHFICVMHVHQVSHVHG